MLAFLLECALSVAKAYPGSPYVPGYSIPNLGEDSGIPNGYTIFLLSFIFGVSHMNKYFLEKGPLGMYIFQVGFTTVFGWWESFVWLKTNSYFTCVFLHSFCNYMQFPDFKEAFNCSISLPEHESKPTLAINRSKS